jgi:hypothetical protein
VALVEQKAPALTVSGSATVVGVVGAAGVGAAGVCTDTTRFGTVVVVVGAAA